MWPTPSISFLLTLQLIGSQRLVNLCDFMVCMFRKVHIHNW